MLTARAEDGRLTMNKPAMLLNRLSDGKFVLQDVGDGADVMAADDPSLSTAHCCVKARGAQGRYSDR